MDKPTDVSGNPIITQKTTGKLPSENPTNDTKTYIGTESNQNGQSKSYNSLQLIVIEGFQVGRGVARIDLNDITRLGCQPGDIVMITGSRTTAAKVVPTSFIDRGQQIIQMDSQVRQNSASGLGERVSVHKANVKDAQKITLLAWSKQSPRRHAPP